MIETLLAENTAALTENNSLLRQLIAMSGPVAPVKVKKEKIAVVAEPLVAELPATVVTTEPEPEPEPLVAELPVTTTVFPTTRNAALNLITESVKNAYANAGDQLQAKKDAFSEIRKSFSVGKASELTDDQLEAFYQEVVKL